MHHGNPTAAIVGASPPDAPDGDPTPRPVATGPAAPLRVGGLVAGVIGLLFAVPLIGALGSSSSMWASIGPSIGALVAALLWGIVRGRKQQAALARARAALASGVPAGPVRLRVEWGGSSSKVRNRFLLLRSDSGQEIGLAPVTSPDGPFDPRGQLWACGVLEPGSSIALRGADDRAPLLSVAPMASVTEAEPMMVHPSSDAINHLLRWDGDPAVPVVPLPADLADAAWRAIHRQRRSMAGLLALIAVPALCTVVQPGLLGATVLTAAVWGGWYAFSRWAARWNQRPLIAALEASGAPADDARFVATALTAARFGLGLPPDPSAPASTGSLAKRSPLASRPAPPLAAPASGWGYAPQTAPSPPGPARRGPFSDESDLRSRSTVSLLIGVALVVVGALVIAASSSSPERRSFGVQATVIESPTAGGGVRLDVPMGMSQIGIDGGANVPPQPWETDDLDPSQVQVGDVVSVELDPNCFCDPQIPGSDRGSVPVLGLILVGLGIAVAVVGRYVPARRAQRDAAAPPAATGAHASGTEPSAPAPTASGWRPPGPPAPPSGQ